MRYESVYKSSKIIIRKGFNWQLVRHYSLPEIPSWSCARWREPANRYYIVCRCALSEPTASLLITISPNCLHTHTHIKRLRAIPRSCRFLRLELPLYLEVIYNRLSIKLKDGFFYTRNSLLISSFACKIWSEHCYTSLLSSPRSFPYRKMQNFIVENIPTWVSIRVTFLAPGLIPPLREEFFWNDIRHLRRRS